MRTSIRMIANVCCMSAWSAARPESTSTIEWPSGASIARSAMRLAELSSTTRIAGADPAPGASMTGSFVIEGSDLVAVRRRTCREPLAEDGQELRRIDGLWDIRGRPGVDAALALPVSDLRSEGYQRKLCGDGQLTHGAHGRVAIHARHHDVLEHDVDVRCLVEGGNALFAALRRDDLDLDPFEQRGEGEDVAEVVIHDQDLHARQPGACRMRRRRQWPHGDQRGWRRADRGGAGLGRRRAGFGQESRLQRRSLEERHCLLYTSPSP